MRVQEWEEEGRGEERQRKSACESASIGKVLFLLSKRHQPYEMSERRQDKADNKLDDNMW